VEVAAAAMRRSLLFGAGVNVATARVGNLLGGGDWGEARLVPDIRRAAVRGDALEIRSPDALRAWQYVLEPLRGYLMLADRLQGDPTAASAFNFGPGPDAECTVRELAERLGELWGKPLATLPAPDGRAVERHGVRLDSSRASARLGWRPAWSLGQTVDAVVEWYRAFERGGDLRAVSLGQIEAYAAAVGAVAATTLPPR
jgi:CDP-glucose 4,6-dehydratase